MRPRTAHTSLKRDMVMCVHNLYIDQSLLRDLRHGGCRNERDQSTRLGHIEIKYADIVNSFCVRALVFNKERMNDTGKRASGLDSQRGYDLHSTTTQ